MAVIGVTVLWLTVLSIGGLILASVFELAHIKHELKRLNDREDKAEARRLAEEATTLYKRRYGDSDEFIPDGQYCETR